MLTGFALIVLLEEDNEPSKAGRDKEMDFYPEPYLKAFKYFFLCLHFDTIGWVFYLILKVQSDIF